MKYTLSENDVKILKISAEDYFSKDSLAVEVGQVYLFSGDKRERWSDWFISSKPTGYFNIFLLNKNKRLPEVKCFALCGSINKNPLENFYVGISKKYEVETSGEIYFFANDTKKEKSWYQRNNKGALKLSILRLK